MPNRALLPFLTLTLALMALAGCGDESSEDASGSPATSPSASVTEIPDDFPLASGMAGPADDLPTSRTGTGVRDLTVCGISPLRGLGIRDRMIADNSGGEAAHTRELVLLGSPAEAVEVARAYSDLALGCDEPEAQLEVEGDMSTATEVRESSFGPAPAATLLQTYEFGGVPGPGTTIIQVVPVGSALLVASIYGEWPAADLEAAVAETGARISDTVAAMAIFGDVRTPSASPSSLPGPHAIPDDFPLDAAMVEDGGDYTRSDPSRDGGGVGEVEMCGRVVWPVAGADDRLVTHVNGPEYADSRELLVFADSDAALAAMAPVRTAYDDCHRAGNRVWTPLAEDTGWDSVTIGHSYDDGLGSSVHQVTRVGSAVLLVTTYGEGSLQSLPGQAADVTDVTAAIAPAMCAFTAAGC